MILITFKQKSRGCGEVLIYINMGVILSLRGHATALHWIIFFLLFATAVIKLSLCLKDPFKELICGNEWYLEFLFLCHRSRGTERGK